MHSFSLKSSKKSEGNNEIDGPENAPSMEEIDISNVLIPTEDTLRYTFILKALTHHAFPAIFIGETGTGKTSTIKKYV